jgi:hypothetical protein
MASAAPLLSMHAAHSASTFKIFQTRFTLLPVQIHVKSYMGLSL